MFYQRAPGIIQWDDLRRKPSDPSSLFPAAPTPGFQSLRPPSILLLLLQFVPLSISVRRTPLPPSLCSGACDKVILNVSALGAESHRFQDICAENGTHVCGIRLGSWAPGFTGVQGQKFSCILSPVRTFGPENLDQQRKGVLTLFFPLFFLSLFSRAGWWQKGYTAPSKFVFSAPLFIFLMAMQTPPHSPRICAKSAQECGLCKILLWLEFPSAGHHASIPFPRATQTGPNFGRGDDPCHRKDPTSPTAEGGQLIWVGPWPS